MPLMPAPPIPTRWICCVFLNMDIRPTNLRPLRPSSDRIKTCSRSPRSNRPVGLMISPRQRVTFLHDRRRRIGSPPTPGSWRSSGSTAPDPATVP